MRTNKKKSFEKILTAIYVILQGAVFYSLWRFVYSVQIHGTSHHNDNIILSFLYILIVYFVAKSLDGFRINSNNRFTLVLSHTLASIITDAVMYFAFLLEFRRIVPFVPMLIILAVNIVVAIVWVLISKAILDHNPPRSCIMFYTDDKDVRYLKRKLDERKDQFNIKKILKITSTDIPEDVFDEGIDSAVIAYMPGELRNELLKHCFKNDIDVILTPKVSDILLRGADELEVVDRPLLELNCSTMTFAEKIIKRAFDFFCSALALLILSPLMLIVVLAVKIQDGGPVLYKQKRCTLDGREFEIYKFRSMVVDAEKNNKAVLASKNDSRITKVGAFIRATRIDELPQLINILKGDMSIVGPRPERKELIDEYTNYIESFPFRTKVKAGLTGYAQLYGKYNSNPYNKLLYDLMYVQKFSLILDLQLILHTLKIIFIKESTDGIDEDFDIFIDTFYKKNDNDNSNSDEN